MSLEFLSREATDKLAHEVGTNIEAYRAEKTVDLIRTGDCRMSRVDAVAPPDLLDTKGDYKPDAEASQLIFQWLSNLTPVQAADERLWVLLTHSTFSEYVHKRWGDSLERSEKPTELILDRWFFRGIGLRRLFHNGISRLWWFGWVTHDNQRANPFELTDALLSLQEIQVAFLERSIGSCKPLLRVVLETVKKHEAALRSTPKRGDVIQGWAKEIRLYGGAYLLDAVPPDRLAFVVERMLRSRLKVPAAIASDA
ncbi:MAG: DUF6339 family protein [Terrimicrobiaceae bacterium]|nr:DUF6339 family protein [Terrimicrobiaceae bacterium]